MTMMEWIQMLNLSRFPIKNSVRMCRISRVSRKFVKQVNWFDVLWTRKRMQKSSWFFLCVFLNSYSNTVQKFVAYSAYHSLVDEWKSTNYPSTIGWNTLWINLIFFMFILTHQWASIGLPQLLIRRLCHSVCCYG